MLHFSFPAPTGPPLNFIVTPGARSMTFSWDPPGVTERNGVITGYSLSCTPLTAEGDIIMQYTQDSSGSGSSSGELVNGISYENTLSGTVGMFIPATQYSCTITASTSAGTGPRITVTVVTCELIEWTFVFHCCFISWLLKLLQPLQEYEPEWVPHH